MGFLYFYSPGYPGRFWRDIEDAHPRTYGAVFKRGGEKVEIRSRMSRAVNQIRVGTWANVSIQRGLRPLMMRRRTTTMAMIKRI